MHLLPSSAIFVQLAVREWTRTHQHMVALFFCGLSFLIAWFVESISIADVEHNKVVIVSQLIRASFIACTVTHVLASLSRAQQSHYMLQQLALPMSRLHWLSSVMLGHASTAAMAAMVWAIPIVWLGRWMNGIEWMCALALEGVVMSACAVGFFLGFRHFTGTWLATLLLYIFGRVWPTLMQMVSQPYMPSSDSALWMNVFDCLGYITPRFDLYANSDLLASNHNMVRPLWQPFIQTLAFIPVVVSVSLIDLRKKEWQ